MRLFKKDDPTFEFNQLDKVRRWRGYVASYMAVEPTEELDYTRLRHPYLKNRLAKTEDLEDDQFEHIKHLDKITVSISPAMYIMKFIASEPNGNGGVQYFVHPKAVAGGSSASGELRGPKEAKMERVRALALHNVAWMKGLSQEEVENSKISFKNDMEKPRETSKDEDGDDVEMAEA